MRMPRLPRRTARILVLLLFAGSVIGALRLLTTPDGWKWFLGAASLAAGMMLVVVVPAGWENLPGVPNSPGRLYKLVRKLSRAPKIKNFARGLGAALILLSLLLFPLPETVSGWYGLAQLPGRVAKTFLLFLLGATTGATSATFFGDWIYHLHTGRRAPPY